MTSQPATQSAVAPVNIKVVESESLLDHIGEVYQAVAERAYELFESRGREQERR